jgi:hypothetical protein
LFAPLFTISKFSCQCKMFFQGRGGNDFYVCDFIIALY